jgi:LPS O-antigen subunit length determinant protein (WzzB/FepE family)
LGGLAPFTGISGETAGARAEAIATLKSRQLGTAFIEERNLLPYLFPELWDTEQNKWAVEAEVVPTMADAFERFDQDVRRIDEDRTTGLINVSILGRDRKRVADWANALVQAANQRLRQRAIHEAEQSVRYLEDQLKKTNILEVRQAMNQLIEAQISKAALANTRDDYAFRVIDPAVELQADQFVKPRRILILALGVAFGLALGFLLALLRQSWSELRQGEFVEKPDA